MKTHNRFLIPHMGKFSRFALHITNIKILIIILQQYKPRFIFKIVLSYLNALILDIIIVGVMKNYDII